MLCCFTGGGSTEGHEKSPISTTQKVAGDSVCVKVEQGPVSVLVFVLVLPNTLKCVH